MSRRFGRNQRRKMRETVAALEQQIDEMAVDRIRAYGKYERLVAEVEHWAAQIVSLLGPDSAFARELCENGVDADLFRSVVEDGRPLRVEPRRGLIGPDKAMAVIELFAVSPVVDEDIVACRRRFMIRSPEGSSAIVMDHRTLHDMVSRRKLAEYLLTQLVQPWVDKRRG